MESDLNPLSVPCHGVMEEDLSSVPLYSFIFLFKLA